ncbi:MAG: TRIC cation channel family protein, partial [Solobacterium sp.]|nr:TRIC cation channel family protein [Solobacterium sp.]
MENLVTILDIIGAIAFAISGAMVAMQNELDLLGVVILACCTATGGGMVRDLFLGHI